MTFQLDNPDSFFAVWHPELYGPHVPKAIIQFFEGAWEIIWKTGEHRDRFRFTYGDPFSGLSHGEEDVGVLGINFETQPFTFTIRHSVTSKRTHGILIDRIVKIETSDRYQIYRHPRFHEPGESPVMTPVSATPGRNARRVVIRKKP